MQKLNKLYKRTLQIELYRYFSNCEDNCIRKLVHNSFIANIFVVPDENQEEIIEIQHFSNLKDTCEAFIWKISGDKKQLHFQRFDTLLYVIRVFSAHLCEQFSALLIIKNKHWNQMMSVPTFVLL